MNLRNFGLLICGLLIPLSCFSVSSTAEMDRAYRAPAVLGPAILAEDDNESQIPPNQDSMVIESLGSSDSGIEINSQDRLAIEAIVSESSESEDHR